VLRRSPRLHDIEQERRRSLSHRDPSLHRTGRPFHQRHRPQHRPTQPRPTPPTQLFPKPFHHRPKASHRLLQRRSIPACIHTPTLARSGYQGHRADLCIRCRSSCNKHTRRSVRHNSRKTDQAWSMTHNQGQGRERLRPSQPIRRRGHWWCAVARGPRRLDIANEWSASRAQSTGVATTPSRIILLTQSPDTRFQLELCPRSPRVTGDPTRGDVPEPPWLIAVEDLVRPLDDPRRHESVPAGFRTRVRARVGDNH
jgi:hypothetical protein